MDDLKNRSINAFLWGAGGTVLRILIQIVSQIILARLLGPEQFGLFATGLVVVFFTNLFADAGLAYGLVQRHHVTDEDVRFIFTWQMLFSFCIAALIFFGADIIAHAFGDARLKVIVQWLSLASIIASAGGTSMALLRRELDFKTINIAAVVSYAIAFFGIGIPMALAGFEAMALVAAFLSQAMISTAIAVASARHPVRPLFWHDEAPSIISFGGTVFFTGLVNWVMTAMDRAIVSSTLGVTAAGLYATMSNLINTPAQSALATLQPVLYAASSRVQDSTERLRTGLRAMFGAISIFVVPVFVGIAVASETIVMAIFGSKWIGGEVVLTPLSLAMPAILLMGLSTPVMWSAGYPRRELQVQIPMAAIWAIICYAAAQSGSLATISWVVCAMAQIRAATIIYCTLLAIEMSPRELPALLMPGFAVSALVAAAAFIADRGLLSLDVPPAMRLPIVIAVCGIAMLAALMAIRAHVPPDVKDLLSRLGARLPAGRVRQTFGRVVGC